jgi:hypothetical protein
VVFESHVKGRISKQPHFGGEFAGQIDITVGRLRFLVMDTHAGILHCPDWLKK